jgi:hypothetical protein
VTVLSSPIVKITTATRDFGFPGGFAHRGGAPETLLCCRGLDFRRAAVTGRERSCRKLENANSAGSLSPLDPRRSVACTTVVARENTWRTCFAELDRPTASQPNDNHILIFEALSLGISGGRAFCFSAESGSSVESARSREHVPGGDIFSRAPRFRNSHTTKKSPLAAIHGENAAPENVEIGRLANLADRKGCERGDRAHVDLARDTTGSHIGVWAQRGGPRGIPDRADF